MNGIRSHLCYGTHNYNANSYISFSKVKRLIEEEACDVNESDLEGFCPLHYAAIYGRIEACKLLLSHGADCTRKNNFGKTPADLAQDSRVQQMIKCMAFSHPLTFPLNFASTLPPLIPRTPGSEFPRSVDE